MVGELATDKRVLGSAVSIALVLFVAGCQSTVFGGPADERECCDSRATLAGRYVKGAGIVCDDVFTYWWKKDDVTLAERTLFFPIWVVFAPAVCGSVAATLPLDASLAFAYGCLDWAPCSGSPDPSPSNGAPESACR